MSAWQALYRAGVVMFLTWSMVPLTFLSPLIDSTRAPYVNLAGAFSDIAYWIALSGSKFGVPIIGVFMLIVLVSRDGISNSRRWKESGVIISVVALFAGGGAAINEHVIKETLKIPRPNIVWLAGDDGAGPLGMTPLQFYETGDKEARRVPLKKTLSQKPKPVLLSSMVEADWIEETGYSFPSGHAFSAMFFATFFLAMAVTYILSARIWWFYALLPWALAVCYSRPILRVHTPLDITVGGLQGLVLGIIAWAFARNFIRKLDKA